MMHRASSASTTLPTTTTQDEKQTLGEFVGKVIGGLANFIQAAVLIIGFLAVYLADMALSTIGIQDAINDEIWILSALLSAATTSIQIIFWWQWEDIRNVPPEEKTFFWGMLVLMLVLNAVDSTIDGLTIYSFAKNVDMLEVTLENVINNGGVVLYGLMFVAFVFSFGGEILSKWAFKQVRKRARLSFEY